MRVRIPGVVLFVLGAIACGRAAWTIPGAPRTAPDEQFRTGVESGYDAWVWHCYEGHRVVVTQASSACFGTRDAEMAKGPCGAPLAEESTFPPAERRDAIPDSLRWPGSKPPASEPASSKPASSKPASSKPAASTPASSKPAASAPASSAPASSASAPSAVSPPDDLSAMARTGMGLPVQPARALAERLAREASSIPAGELRTSPRADPERDAAIRARYGQECRLERTCGPLWGVDCGAAADGPYYYVRPSPDGLHELATCGGACMGGRCTDCPPKSDGWTCAVY
jgi:hypothetical protein